MAVAVQLENDANSLKIILSIIAITLIAYN